MQYDEGELDRRELLDSFIRDYGDDLKRIAYLYLNDLAESEDIVQEVLIKSYHQLDSFRHESSYKTWLIRMTINQCKDHKKRWSVRNIFYKQEVPEVRDRKLTETDYIQKESSNEMLQQLARLAPKHKEVLILYYYEELTMQEISDVLQINYNTVKSRLLRGKQVLKEKLERSEGHG
ncbi:MULTISPECIES: sigma-70 family RNA polymerase sigma factor [unclassified Sporosarcina]|uniref:sigma-70 family RNA polymerase sigma factor n=1 Tax=unclassified Sporosarcina TaxID=2647733 RepID=UPI00203E260B|nr:MULTISPECIES: sigma-70 family RNA polymerase sigma factor [unclassified Sporosarcina]GKV65126.1 RNA polymerase sigma factor [Sporosarcina sp. NCCP-2331]GLB55250.1 RNA polymerase sigma factor [Sporosarcina sp. NCCP-2378]